MVRAWNPDNGTVPRTFSGAADYVFAVAASSDGARVAAGGADGVLLLWNGVNGQPLRKIAPGPAK
jgi:WD40 repeat protein